MLDIISSVIFYDVKESFQKKLKIETFKILQIKEKFLSLHTKQIIFIYLNKTITNS